MPRGYASAPSSAFQPGDPASTVRAVGGGIILQSPYIWRRMRRSKMSLPTFPASSMTYTIVGDCIRHSVISGRCSSRINKPAVRQAGRLKQPTAGLVSCDGRGGRTFLAPARPMRITLNQPISRPSKGPATFLLCRRSLRAQIADVKEIEAIRVHLATDASNCRGSRLGEDAAELALHPGLQLGDYLAAIRSLSGPVNSGSAERSPSKPTKASVSFFFVTG